MDSTAKDHRGWIKSQHVCVVVKTHIGFEVQLFENAGRSSHCSFPLPYEFLGALLTAEILFSCCSAVKESIFNEVQYTKLHPGIIFKCPFHTRNLTMAEEILIRITFITEKFSASKLNLTFS